MSEPSGNVGESERSPTPATTHGWQRQCREAEELRDVLLKHVKLLTTTALRREAERDKAWGVVHEKEKNVLNLEANNKRLVKRKTVLEHQLYNAVQALDEAGVDSSGAVCDGIRALAEELGEARRGSDETIKRADTQEPWRRLVLDNVLGRTCELGEATIEIQTLVEQASAMRRLMEDLGVGRLVVIEMVKELDELANMFRDERDERDDKLECLRDVLEVKADE